MPYYRNARRQSGAEDLLKIIQLSRAFKKPELTPAEQMDKEKFTLWQGLSPEEKKMTAFPNLLKQQQEPIAPTLEETGDVLRQERLKAGLHPQVAKEYETETFGRPISFAPPEEPAGGEPSISKIKARIASGDATAAEIQAYKDYLFIEKPAQAPGFTPDQIFQERQKFFTNPNTKDEPISKFYYQIRLTNPVLADSLASVETGLPAERVAVFAQHKDLDSFKAALNKKVKSDKRYTPEVYKSLLEEARVWFESPRGFFDKIMGRQ